MQDRRGASWKRILSACGIILALCILWIALPVTGNGEVEEIRRLLGKEGHVIHAGGLVTGGDGEEYSYTNSLEALTNLYARGDRVCEIDLQETVDGLLICGHGDENELVFGTGLPRTATGREFLAGRIYGCLTPISFTDLADFLREHPDLFVVTDVKTDNLRVCARMAEEAPDIQDQLLVQIQLPEEYDAIRRLGYRNILYPVFRTPDEQRDVFHLAAFAREHPLAALILPNGYYSPDLKLFLAQKIIGVPIVLHTLNDDWEMAYYLDHHLALAVYTDRTEF